MRDEVYPIANPQALDFGGERVTQFALSSDDPMEIRTPGASVVRGADQGPMVFLPGERRRADDDPGGRRNSNLPPNIERDGARLSDLVDIDAVMDHRDRVARDAISDQHFL